MHIAKCQDFQILNEPMSGAGGEDKDLVIPSFVSVTWFQANKHCDLEAYLKVLQSLVCAVAPGEKG